MAETTTPPDDEPASDTVVDSLRAQLQRAAPGLGETLITTLTEAISATKRVRIQRDCPKCHCAHIDFVEIQDSVAAVNAVKVLIEQAEGRPGIADQEQAEPLIFERAVYDTVDAPFALELLNAGYPDMSALPADHPLVQLRAELESSLPLDHEHGA